jgi:hypothetical protein
MDFVSLSDGKGCCGNGSLKCRFLGQEFSFNIPIVKDAPTIARLDNGISCKSYRDLPIVYWWRATPSARALWKPQRGGSNVEAPEQANASRTAHLKSLAAIVVPSLSDLPREQETVNRLQLARGMKRARKT